MTQTMRRASGYRATSPAPSLEANQKYLCYAPRRMDLTHKIVRRLLRDDDVEFSRNKNFDAYEDPMVKRALRIYRHLRSVEDDLLAAGGGDVTLEAVEREDEQVVVRLSYPAGNARRESFVTEEEWELLLESERIADILTRLVDVATENEAALIERWGAKIEDTSE